MTGGKTLAELTQHHDIHPNQITDWKHQLLERAAQVFDGPKPEAGPVRKELHAKIGQQALEIDFLSGALGRIRGASAKP